MTDGDTHVYQQLWRQLQARQSLQPNNSQRMGVGVQARMRYDPPVAPRQVYPGLSSLGPPCAPMDLADPGQHGENCCGAAALPREQSARKVLRGQ
jgi:hypothetical protein